MDDHGLRVGDVAVMPLPDGGYGACQVTFADRDEVDVLALRWHSAQPPALADLAGVAPLVLDHHAHDGVPAHHRVSRNWPAPVEFVRLGTLPVPADVRDRPHSWTGWRSLPGDVVRQRQWDRDLPTDAKEAYRRAATRGPVEVDFGGGAVTVGGAVGGADLTGAGTFAVPVDGPVHWSALDRLARCTTLFWSGPDRGLTAALRARPVISTLVWRAAPAEVDLTGTGLTHVTLAGDDLRDLRLPRGVHGLTLVAPTVRLAVHAADEGRWLHVVARNVTEESVVPSGLRRTREITLDGGGVLSTASLAALDELRELSLVWRRPPGGLRDADGLARFDALTMLSLVDGYGVDEDTLPELPALRHLSMHGLRRSAVAPLRERCRRTGVRVVLQGAKADTWLAANLDNPLRDWVDDDDRGGAAACRAYATALRAIDKLPAQDAARRAGAERALRSLVDRLNQIERKHGIIDTVRREEAAEAFVGLAARAGVPEPLAGEWLDDWRDF